MNETYKRLFRAAFPASGGHPFTGEEDQHKLILCDWLEEFGTGNQRLIAANIRAKVLVWSKRNDTV